MTWIESSDGIFRFVDVFKIGVLVDFVEFDVNGENFILLIDM